MLFFSNTNNKEAKKDAALMRQPAYKLFKDEPHGFESFCTFFARSHAKIKISKTNEPAQSNLARKLAHSECRDTRTPRRDDELRGQSER